MVVKKSRSWASLAVAAAVATALGPVTSALGAIWLRFEPPKAAPGGEVRAETVGPAMSQVPSRSLTLFLAPEDAADSVRSTEDPNLAPIGELLADSSGLGRLTFVVPDLLPGKYVAVAFCRDCGDGGTVFTVGSFEVAGSDAPGRSDSTDGILLRAILGALLVVLLLSGAAVAGRRRRARRLQGTRAGGRDSAEHRK